MHHPKHLYITGIVTGALCGVLSALTVWMTYVYIGSQDLEKTNPVTVVAAISIVVGGIIGLIVSFAVHKISKTKA